MIRNLVAQNFTSFSKPLGWILGKWVRKYSVCGPVNGTKGKLLIDPPPPPMKVTICGANGQVGQIIAFLLKQSPLVDIISLYDLDNTYGLAMDLAHIDTGCRVQSYSGCADLYEAMWVSGLLFLIARHMRGHNTHSTFPLISSRFH